MKYTLLIASLFCFFTAHRTFAQSLKADKEVARVLATVKPQTLAAHVNYLADDRLRGRLPGTPGYQMAVDYVIARLKEARVTPAGENGTYLQKINFRKAFTNKEASLALINKAGQAEPLTLGKDYILYPHFEHPSVSFTAPLVFVGSGISAPELGYDDYAGVDVKGKIVVLQRSAPKKFPSSVAASSMNLTTILQTALKHGAVGVIIGSYTANLRELNGVTSIRLPNGKIAAAGSYVSEEIKLLSIVTPQRFNNLLQSANLDTTQIYASLAAGKPVSTALPGSVKVAYQSRYQDFESYNVIGKITGSDAQLKNENVIHTAHLDHMGVGKPVKGDSIYNGAHDNASGVACLLEIARTYSELKVKPKRSILIALVTGEEMGLLGSAYLAQQPVVPAQSIVANINTDMPTLIAPLLSVVALGAEHSSLSQPVNEAATYLNLAVEADPEPEQNRFVRSDQYSFVKQGIPALHIKYGNKTADGANNLNKSVQQWRATYYHQPQDNPDGVFDYNAGKTYVHLNFLISYLVAQNPTRPAWNSGSFFLPKAALNK